MTTREKIDRIRSSGFAGKGDIVFILCLLCFIAASLYVVYRPMQNGDLRAVVRVDGQVYGSYALDNDAEVEIDDKLTVVIENGTVCVRNPACPDKVCAAFGKISRVHEVIVCAPEGITIRITGESEIHAGAR